jgi:hypothetical protein
LAARARFCRGLEIRQLSLNERADGAAARRVSPRSCQRQSKESWKMNWFKKVREPEPEPVRKPAAEEKASPKTLRIEELEERIVPNAIWGD